MKTVLVVLATVALAVFVGCGTSQLTQSNKTDEGFEVFGFEGVKETASHWFVTGISNSRDLGFATTIAAMDARIKLINFLAKPRAERKTRTGEQVVVQKEYSLSMSIVERQRFKKLDNGTWAVKVILTAPKAENPKEN